MFSNYMFTIDFGKIQKELKQNGRLPPAYFLLTKFVKDAF